MRLEDLERRAATPDGSWPGWDTKQSRTESAKMAQSASEAQKQESTVYLPPPEPTADIQTTIPNPFIIPTSSVMTEASQSGSDPTAREPSPSYGLNDVIEAHDNMLRQSRSISIEVLYCSTCRQQWHHKQAADSDCPYCFGHDTGKPDPSQCGEFKSKDPFSKPTTVPPFRLPVADQPPYTGTTEGFTAHVFGTNEPQQGEGASSQGDLREAPGLPQPYRQQENSHIPSQRDPTGYVGLGMLNQAPIFSNPWSDAMHSALFPTQYGGNSDTSLGPDLLKQHDNTAPVMLNHLTNEQGSIPGSSVPGPPARDARDEHDQWDMKSGVPPSLEEKLDHIGTGLAGAKSTALAIAEGQAAVEARTMQTEDNEKIGVVAAATIDSLARSTFESGRESVPEVTTTLPNNIANRSSSISSHDTAEADALALEKQRHQKEGERTKLIQADALCAECGYRPDGDPQLFWAIMANHKKLEHSTSLPKTYNGDSRLTRIWNDYYTTEELDRTEARMSTRLWNGASSSHGYAESWNPSHKDSRTVTGQTDSGYASLSRAKVGPGHDHLDTESMAQEEAVAGDEASDIGTIYSDDRSQASVSRTQRYISEFADHLFGKIKHHVHDCSGGKLEDCLPELLQAFALKLGQSSSTRGDLEIMYFVHKHRRYCVEIRPFKARLTRELLEPSLYHSRTD